MEEIEVYAVHFARQNLLPKVMSEETVEALRRCRGAVVPCKDANLYLGSFVFRTPEQRDEFCEACDDHGIYISVEEKAACIPAEDVPEAWKAGEYEHDDADKRRGNG